MPRAILLVLCASAVFGQARPEPFDAAIQAYWDARGHGDFDAAVARREEAREMLARMSLSSPTALGRIRNLAQIYDGLGRRAQARAVVEDALARAGSDLLRVDLLSMLGDYWQQDGNLLRALSYREQAVAAAESPAAKDAPTAPPMAIGVLGASPQVVRLSIFSTAGGFRPGRSNHLDAHQRLADLYRELGRPEAAAKAMEKLRRLIQDDPRELAQFHERQGEVDEAVAVYRKQVAAAVANPEAQPWEVTGPLQSIAGLYQSQQRWDEAIAAMQQAVQLVESNARAEVRGQAFGMRLFLASLLAQAKQDGAAEQVYKTLLNETDSDRDGQHAQVLQAYANELSATDRGAEAERLLKGYLENSAVSPPEQVNILFSLSGIAGNAGRKELAEEYQRSAMEKQRSIIGPEQPEEGLFIGPDLQKANEAATRGDLDEAVEIALRVMASASRARDSEQIAWQIPSIADALAGRKPEEAERLYRGLLGLLEAWSVDNASLLSQGRQQYARFLIGQKDRWAEVLAAIDRYGEYVTAVEGAESSAFEQAIELRIEFARARGDQAEAVRRVEELLLLEASLSGTTSQPYLRAVQTAAGVYESAGDRERALGLNRQMIAIADVCFSPHDVQRGFLRMNAAFQLANLRQFEDAERLASEAVAISKQARPPQPDLFTQQVEQIRRMKSESAPMPVRGVSATGGHWFTYSDVRQ